ncbi:MAG: hypothetical protein AAF682_19725 [Planctomycetota bacterium]
MQPKLHVGDEGVRFLATLYVRNDQGVRVVADLTNATELVAKWRKEDGAVVQGPASVYGAPTEGKALAVAPAGLFDQVGKTWAFQLDVTLGGFSGHTSKASFEVDHVFGAA